MRQPMPDFSNLSDDELDRYIEQRRIQVGNQDSLATAQPDATAQVDPSAIPSDESPFSFWDRTKASFLRDDQRDRFLQRQLPEGSTLGPEGQFVTDAQGMRSPVDPSGLDLGDVADVVGDIPALSGSLVGGLGGGSLSTLLGLPTGPGAALTGATGMMAGAATGGGAGDLFRQGVGELIEPAQGQEQFPDYGQMGEEARMAGLGEALGPPLVRGGLEVGKQALRLPRWGMDLGKGPSVRGAEAIADAQRLGVPPEQLPLGTTSDSPFLSGLDAVLRRSGVTGKQFREGDEILQTSMEDALTRTRGKVGGEFAQDATLSSGIEPSLLNFGMIDNNTEQNKALAASLDNLHQQFEQAIGQPFGQVKIDTPALDALQESAEFLLEDQPALGMIDTYGGMKRFFAGAKMESLRQVMGLREAAGELIEMGGGSADTGRRLYAAVLSDMETGIIDALPLGELQGSAAMTAYRRMLNTARRQFEVGQSSLVKILFKDRQPNVFVLDEVADRIRSRSVGVADVIMLKERLGLGGGVDTGLDFANRLKGNIGYEKIPLPATAKGAFLWDQVKQLYLDKLLQDTAQSSADPEVLKLGGVQFYKALFGNDQKARVTREIFGVATPDIKAFANLLRDVGVSQRMFAGSPTGPINEYMNVFSLSVPNITSLVARLGISKQIAKPHLGGGGKLVGSEFFQKGALPDIDGWIRNHRIRIELSRLPSQIGIRAYEQRKAQNNGSR